MLSVRRGDPAVAAGVPALLMPAAGSVSVTAEAVSGVGPQWLAALSPAAELVSPRLRPGAATVLSRPVEAGEVVVLRLSSDLRGRGGPGVLSRETGGPGVLVEPTAPDSWLVRFPAVPDSLFPEAGAGPEALETRVRVDLLDADRPAWPGVVGRDTGAGRAVLVTAEPTPDADGAWAGLLGALVERVAPRPDRPRPGAAVGVVVALRGIGVPARADVTLRGSDGAVVEEAAAGVLDGGAAVWEDVDLAVEQRLAARVRLPARPGAVELEARVQRRDRPHQTLSLPILVLPVVP